MTEAGCIRQTSLTMATRSTGNSISSADVFAEIGIARECWSSFLSRAAPMDDRVCAHI